MKALWLDIASVINKDWPTAKITCYRSTKTWGNIRTVV